MVFTIRDIQYIQLNRPFPNLPRLLAYRKSFGKLVFMAGTELVVSSKFMCTVIQSGFSIVKFTKKVCERI